MIVRSFANGFEVADYTQELVTVPNQWGTIGGLGLFSTESVAEHTVNFEEIIKDGALIVDRVRGDRATVGKDATRKLHVFAVPHFPYDDAISPSDIQGKRAYGTPDGAETLDAVRMRKIERIRQNHAWTLEYARAKAITTGDVYAPNGTVSQNWFTEFGITQKSIDGDLGDSSTNVIAKVEEGIAHIQDNSGGDMASGVVVLCSPEWFAKLIAHANVTNAYTYYSSTQEPLRQRLGGFGLHREFFWAGARFIEMRDTYDGNRLIPASEAYMLPTGTQAFKTFFSPANKFGLTNTLGEQAYLFEYPSMKGDKIELESESNFVNAILRPAMVVKYTTST